MSELISFMLSHYQLLIVVMMTLIVITLVGSIYFTVKFATSAAIDRFVDEFDFLEDLNEYDIKKLIEEQKQTNIKIQKLYSVMAKLHKEGKLK